MLAWLYVPEEAMVSRWFLVESQRCGHYTCNLGSPASERASERVQPGSAVHARRSRLLAGCPSPLHVR